METLKIKKENALKAFLSADKGGKTLLSDLFGADIFRSRIEIIDTYEDACKIEGITPLTIEDFKALPEEDRLPPRF